MAQQKPIYTFFVSGFDFYTGTMSRIVLRRKSTLSQRLSLVHLSALGVVFAVLVWLVGGYLHSGGPGQVSAATTMTTVPAGSFIVNMGVVPQTVGNALKPYGLVYEMMITHGIPVLWVIEPSKPKDGIDFTYNGTDYRGGTFIIPSSYITQAVQDSIGSWMARGVVGEYSLVSMTLPVCMEISNFPSTVVDQLSGNQDIIIDYFNNAGIPSSAYRLGTPSTINNCDDLWVNPHGDPAWSTHGALWNFINNLNGNIWSQCHAVSMLENVRNPLDTTQKLNFLTTNGLQCWARPKPNQLNAPMDVCGVAESHAGVPNGPFNHFLPTDPVMQFMGNTDSATFQGSEQWFIPLTSSQWRSMTKKCVTTQNQQGTPRQGMKTIYGPAYDDPSKGLVMYQGSHNLFSGDSATQFSVAAQRSFLNFCFVVGKRKQFVLNSTTIQGTYVAGMPAYLSVSASGGSPAYTYSWTTTLSGTFSSTTTPSTVFTPSLQTATQTGTITVTITDACNRVQVQTINVTSSGSALPVNLLWTKARRTVQGVEVEWSTGSETDNDYFTVWRSEDGHEFQPIGIKDAPGNSNQVRSYFYLDNEAPSGELYYRISQTDFNGHSESFTPVHVEGMDSDVLISVYPNPVSRKTTILLTSRHAGKGSLEVWSMSGKLILQQLMRIEEGENSLNFQEIDRLPVGKFILRVRVGDQLVGTTRLVKLF